DGRPWRLGLAEAAEGLRKLDEQVRKEGYVPVDVAGYQADGERYCALWVKAAGEETRLYVGVADADHKRDGWEPLKQAGFVPHTYQILVDDRGGKRSSAVWGKSKPQPGYSDAPGE